MTDRRGLLAGLGAMALAGPALAAKKPAAERPKEELLFKSGRLADNSIANMFTVPAKPLVWPARTRLIGEDDKRMTLEAHYGQLLLVDLWAEWCVPCLSELAGVAYHQKHATDGKLKIIPICTGSRSFRRPSHAKPLLAKVRASDLATWVDVGPEGSQLIDTVAIDPDTGRGAVPCMLLIDPTGVIRGHALGGFEVTVEVGALAGKETNAWNTSVSVEFLDLLKAEGLPKA